MRDGIRKEPRYDEPLIADFIRSDRCISCGAPPPSTVSHTARRGRSGNNASILRAVPQCLACHRLYEDNLLEISDATIELYREKVAAYLCQRIREFTGEQKAPTRAKKPATKPKSDFTAKCAALTDEQLTEAGIRLPETMKRIHNGIIGAVEKRKLKEYFTNQ